MKKPIARYQIFAVSKDHKLVQHLTTLKYSIEAEKNFLKEIEVGFNKHNTTIGIAILIDHQTGVIETPVI